MRALVFAVLGLLGACSGGDYDTYVCEACGVVLYADTGYHDDDGDGYPRGDDCDDADAAVHPEAAETCNGQDDDCDMEIDEGVCDSGG